jgi:hypothetical protein
VIAPPRLPADRLHEMLKKSGRVSTARESTLKLLALIADLSLR